MSNSNEEIINLLRQILRKQELIEEHLSKLVDVEYKGIDYLKESINKNVQNN